MNAIIGNIHILKQDEHLVSQVGSIETFELSSLNLLSLINDILDFSKMEDKKVYFCIHLIDLHKIVRDIVSTYTIKALNFILGLAKDQSKPDIKTDSPVVALTVSVSTESEEAAAASGMNDYLTKPISLKNLREVLNKMIVKK